MKSRLVVARIEAHGGTLIRTKGSHQRFRVMYVDASGQPRTAYTTVQGPTGKEIPVGTLKAIQRDLEAAFGEGWLLR